MELQQANSEPTTAQKRPEALSLLNTEGSMAEQDTITEDTAAHKRVALLERLRATAVRQHRWSRFMTALYTVGITSYLGLSLAYTLHWNTFNPGSLVFFYAIASVGVNIVNARWRVNMAKLVKTVDVEAVSTLVEGLDMHTNGTLAQDMLIEKLPRLRADQASLLSPVHYGILNRYLGRPSVVAAPKNVALVLAILKAYEQIGSSQAVEAVTRLAEGHGYAAKSPAVREAAQQTLPFVQQRAAQEQAQQTLLRAASGNDASSGETLLRAAEGVSPVRSEQLLRAGSNPGALGE